MLMILARLVCSESFWAVVKVRSPHTGPEVCYIIEITSLCCSDPSRVATRHGERPQKRRHSDRIWGPRCGERVATLHPGCTPPSPGPREGLAPGRPDSSGRPRNSRGVRGPEKLPPRAYPCWVKREIRARDAVPPGLRATSSFAVQSLLLRALTPRVGPLGAWRTPPLRFSPIKLKVNYIDRPKRTRTSPDRERTP